MTKEERKQKQDALGDDALAFSKCIRRPPGTPLEELSLTMDSLHEFLQSVIDAPIGLRRKMVMIRKFMKPWESI